MPLFGCHLLDDWEASSVDGIDGRLVGGLIVLAAIADARSFGRAAERLGMTQSGVSKAIAKLESRLGSRLVHRTSRAVELTDAGRALYERVVQHLAGIGEAAAETAKSREAVRGRLRVNVDPLFSRMVLSPNLSEFLLQNPWEINRNRFGDQAGRMPGRFRNRAGHRPEARPLLRKRGAHQLVPRLAGRTISALRLLCFSELRAGESKEVHRFHRRLSQHGDRNSFEVRPCRQG
jgi:DNA-binding transcriptional LysR family regulator